MDRKHVNHKRKTHLWNLCRHRMQYIFQYMMFIMIVLSTTSLFFLFHTFESETSVRISSSNTITPHSSSTQSIQKKEKFLIIPPKNILQSQDDNIILTNDKVNTHSTVDAIANNSVHLHAQFKLISHEFVTEYNATSFQYKHESTGMEVLSILWNNYESKTGSSLSTDNERVFGITFRTPPVTLKNHPNQTNESILMGSSNGLPHILEHSVLCGSQKYPAKDPFLHLLKSSLQTYLNAMTFPDRTVYAVASRNVQDFYNLVDVYMDAVFFPNCVNKKEDIYKDNNNRTNNDGELIFMQEGWNYKFKEPNTNTALENQKKLMNNDSKPYLYQMEYGGIVYNEMKGSYSSPDSLLQRYSMTNIFPDSIYKFDSGGDPNEIPNITFEEFRSFHQTFYHPSNAKIFVSGLQNHNETKHVWNMITNVLNKYTSQQQLTTDSNNEERIKQTMNDNSYKINEYDNQINVSTSSSFKSFSQWESLSKVLYQKKSPFSFSKKRYPYPTSSSSFTPESNQTIVKTKNQTQTGENATQDSISDTNTHYMLTTWLINDNKMITPFEELVWTVLNHLLIGNPSSILYKSLMESRLGSALSEGSGFQAGLLQATFSIGLKGVKNTHDIQQVETLIMDTLHHIVIHGFSKEDIEASMNTVEFMVGCYFIFLDE